MPESSGLASSALSTVMVIAGLAGAEYELQELNRREPTKNAETAANNNSNESVEKTKGSPQQENSKTQRSLLRDLNRASETSKPATEPNLSKE